MCERAPHSAPGTARLSPRFSLSHRSADRADLDLADRGRNRRPVRDGDGDDGSHVSAISPGTTAGDLHAAGQQGLRVQCQACPSVTCYPFRYLGQAYGVRRKHLVTEIVSRLACGKCGTHPTSLDGVRTWRHDDWREERDLAIEADRRRLMANP